MKVTQKTFAASAARAAGEARVFYFCGPDDGGAADAHARIAMLLGLAERVDMAGADLRKDPVRLTDEARSVSLFGDKRQIHVRCQGDEAYDAVANLLADPIAGWPVLILATAATDKSRLAKLLADRRDALVAVFHPPDLRAVTDAVRDMAGAAGLRMSDDIAERIARGAGLDTRLARTEIDKLALYLDASAQAPRTATGAALDAIGATRDDENMTALVNAVLGGETTRLAAELARAAEQGANPVALVMALERRTAQLAQLAGNMGQRNDINGFLDDEIAARRVYFRDKAMLGAQLRRWRGRRLERLIDRLISLHCMLVNDSRQADLALNQGLAEIIRAAAR